MEACLWCLVHVMLHVCMQSCLQFAVFYPYDRLINPFTTCVRVYFYHQP